MSSRRQFRFALLAILLTLGLAPTVSVAAEDDAPDLAVTITSLSPATLRSGDAITMSGTVTNRNDFVWGNLQAYLVIPRAPFTSRGQIESAITNGAAYTGERVVELDSFDSMGDLAPGATVSFRVRVDWDDLRLTGAEGIYPTGIQILGTRPDGSRSNIAIGRATTFLPLVEPQGDPVPATVVWPFLMPIHRGVAGDYVEPADLVTAISEGGRLRNLLDLAASTTSRSSTILIDPALLDGVADLVENRDVADRDQLDPRAQRQAETFLDDLRALTRRGSTWVLGYGRPDELALSRHPDLAPDLRRTIARATDDALATHSVTGRPTTWLTRRGVTPELLAQVRGDGDEPVIASSDDLRGWDRRDGSIVTYDSAEGPVPVLVTDDLDAGVPGRDSAVTVRQRILSEAALAVLQRGVDPQGRADAVTIVSPTWNPGTDWAAVGLSEAFSARYVEPATLDDLITRPRGRYDGSIGRPTATPLGRSLLDAVHDLVARGGALTDVSTNDDELVSSLARDAAPLLGVQWRETSGNAIVIANQRRDQIDEQLSQLTIEGPPSFTLSGTQGRFPLTISNNTPYDVSVGVRIQSSNPALTIPDVEPIEISAGERNTLTVNVDVGRQNTSTVTATLVSPQGLTLGEPAVFNVRSSNVGLLIWIAMGLAALLVVVAIGRRLLARRHASSTVPDPSSDGHD